jgi:hypothetical protein
MHGCVNQPGSLQKLQVLNNSRAGYRQTARELAGGARCACETLKDDYADRETEQREQAQDLPEQRCISVGLGHFGSVMPN